MSRHVELSPGALDVALYGDNSSFLTSYLDQQLSAMGQYSSGVTNRLHELGQRSYDYVSNTMRDFAVREELIRAGVEIIDNYFKPLRTFDELRNANVTMQRYIMAEPTVRELYLGENIAGYEDTYNYVSQAYSDGVADDDYDYRRVMNGVFVMSEDEEDDTYYRTHYHEELIDGDRELTFMEQCDILETWDYIRDLLEETKFDFTSSSEEPQRINVQ